MDNSCTVVGPYIRCFLARKGQTLQGLWPGDPGSLESYMDPQLEDDAAIIKRTFENMTALTPPSRMPVLPDHASGSYRSSPPGRVSPSGSSPSGKGSFPEPHLPLLPPAGPLSSEQELARRDRSLSTRSMSPERPSPGPPGLQGQSSPLTYRQRSPPQGSTSSRQAPMATPRTPLPAVSLVESWGRDFDSTNFLVRVEGSGESFHRLGEEFKRGTVQDRSGRDVPCYFTSHNKSSIYVLSLDPRTIQRTRDAAKVSLPKWVKK
ncbi:hypothetical protein QBC33DRAFT_358303 [Phialemonium atrogriseum]|uniref:Uncharacterized protein n=1 Tax=Phialemonium atrogriseum TaxID=1093897 RepID=A0AAJ0C3B4_9PEZI|nr:uncharacterized protein QBC33DRAFT_358303 [Phialemonium atrogriseum]KAK1768737.1 hypothetical protein QBC33DRAFT_358303 [Phialemonium atrogriseum]